MNFMRLYKTRPSKPTVLYNGDCKKFTSTTKTKTITLQVKTSYKEKIQLKEIEVIQARLFKMQIRVKMNYTIRKKVSQKNLQLLK